MVSTPTVSRANQAGATKLIASKLMRTSKTRMGSIGHRAGARWPTWKRAPLCAGSVERVTRPCLRAGADGSYSGFNTNYTGLMNHLKPLLCYVMLSTDYVQNSSQRPLGFAFNCFNFGLFQFLLTTQIT